MADAAKIGTPWNDDDLDAIVTDYFAMLDSELSRRGYVKSHHSAALMDRIGRTHRSVEFKHQNISAVLQEMGMPWIPGYKPKAHYQNALFDAIDRYLTAHSDVGELAERQSQPWLPEVSLFVDSPALVATARKPERLETLIRKFDPALRDERNRALGRAGEEFVFRVERDSLNRNRRDDLANKVRWVAQDEGDGAGFDILSFDASGRERRIEVKTTNGAARTPFFLSRNEHVMSERHTDSWQLYRVHLFAQTPHIFVLKPPLGQWVNLQTESWRASFSDTKTE
jgi:hypothetical protein